jgi:hypothetical protein
MAKTRTVDGRATSAGDDDSPPYVCRRGSPRARSVARSGSNTTTRTTQAERQPVVAGRSRCARPLSRRAATDSTSRASCRRCAHVARRPPATSCRTSSRGSSPRKPSLSYRSAGRDGHGTALSGGPSSRPARTISASSSRRPCSAGTKAAEDAVDAGVLELELLGVEDAELHVRDPELAGHALRRLHHLRSEVARDQPSGPRRPAARKPVSPVPAASSRSISPDFGSMRSASHSLTCRVNRHDCSRRRSHGRTSRCRSS